MIKVYTQSVFQSSTKQAISWLEKQHLEHKVLLFARLTEDDVIEMLKNSERGFEDLLKDKGKYHLTASQLSLMTTRDVIYYIIQQPLALKCPIIINDKNTLVGFNDDQMHILLPRIRNNRTQEELGGR